MTELRGDPEHQSPRLELEVESSSEKKQKQEQNRHRLCDFCGDSIALLYCRADSAKLCFNCDKEVHSTNQLFTKHTRSLLCDACDSSPASIFCYTDTSVLCQNCDWELHNNCHNSGNTHALSSVHDRRPLEGFTGCPSVTELLNILGFEDFGKKALLSSSGDTNNAGRGDSDDGGLFSDWLVWDTPSVVSLDDVLVVSDESSGCGRHSFQAMGVPPPPKNRNAACGQHKEELISQLREMAKLEPDFDDSLLDLDSLSGLEFLVPDKNENFEGKGVKVESNAEHAFRDSDEVNAFQHCSETNDIADQGFSSSFLGRFVETNRLVPDRDSDIVDNYVASGHEGPHCPLISDGLQVSSRYIVHELNSQERDSAISRYKEKKKARRYEKHIRYESRKIRAESRTRIKGRFAKKDR